MPFDLRVITPPDFVRIDRYGKVDPEASRQLLRAAFYSCAVSRIKHILVDIRQLQGETSLRELRALADDLGHLGMNRSYRLAVLHRPRTIHAGFLADSARHQGWQVASFESFEEAFLWLDGD